MDNSKKKRGRPRKSVELISDKSKDDKKDKDENIVLFLALSDEDINSDEDNRFTVNDTETKNDAVDSISESESDSESNESESSNEFTSQKHVDVNVLFDEIKKRDAIISNLKNKTPGVLSMCTTSKQSNLNYHCVQLGDSNNNNDFFPKKTNIHCWWCDEGFDNLPAYIVNYYKNGRYYVFGNFCSFNCAAKYNLKMLKDYKCNTRYALTQSLKAKVTGDNSPIKPAPERELLKKKGGIYSIEKFREGFSFGSTHMSMPPIIPLVHVIEDAYKE